MNDIQEQIKDQLAPFVGEPNTKTVREKIIDILKKIVCYEDKLNFAIIEENGIINVQPKDIYTALLLDGVKIPYELVKDAQSYETEQKQYRIINDELTIKNTKCICGQPIYSDGVCVINYMKGNCGGNTDGY